MDPLEIASNYFQEMKSVGGSTHFCLSTLSPEGFPNSRFLDLKGIDQGGFSFGTDMRSTKAREFLSHSRVAACLWWEAIGIQIRIQGEVIRTDLETTEGAFAERNPTAKATSALSQQSQGLQDPEDLKRRILEMVQERKGNIPRPPTWWLWRILPAQIEFLEFREDRIHVRTRYEREGDTWVPRRLSP